MFAVYELLDSTGTRLEVLARFYTIEDATNYSKSLYEDHGVVTTIIEE